jgi:bacterioferritin-associated ferredoxin
MAKKFTVELENRDRIEIQCDDSGTVSAIRASGCLDLLNKVKTIKGLLPASAKKLFVFQDHEHSSLMLNEVLLRALGKWDLPYKEVELCHCRAVPLKNVEAAIISGFHTVEQIAEQTSAGTACGTCRPNTQSCIDYRLTDPLKAIRES